jgi:quinol monooxygenase YgiN
MPIYQTAKFRVKPDAVPVCIAVIEDFITYIRENEPGTLKYESFQSRDDPTEFINVFIFVDENIRDLHANSEGVKKFTAILYPNLIAPIKFTTHHLVATTQ